MLRKRSAPQLLTSWILLARSAVSRGGVDAHCPSEGRPNMPPGRRSTGRTPDSATRCVLTDAPCDVLTALTVTSDVLAGQGAALAALLSGEGLGHWRDFEQDQAESRRSRRGGARGGGCRRRDGVGGHPAGRHDQGGL